MRETVPAGAVPRSLSVCGEASQGSRGSRTDPGHRVFLKGGDCRQHLVEPVADYHLQRHLANPPGVIVQCCLHGRQRLVPQAQSSPRSAQTLHQ